MQAQKRKPKGKYGTILFSILYKLVLKTRIRCSLKVSSWANCNHEKKAVLLPFTSKSFYKWLLKIWAQAWTSEHESGGKAKPALLLDVSSIWSAFFFSFLTHFPKIKLFPKINWSRVRNVMAMLGSHSWKKIQRKVSGQGLLQDYRTNLMKSALQSQWESVAQRLPIILSGNGQTFFFLNQCFAQ